MKEFRNKRCFFNVHKRASKGEGFLNLFSFKENIMKQTVNIKLCHLFFVYLFLFYVSIIFSLNINYIFKIIFVLYFQHRA